MKIHKDINYSFEHVQKRLDERHNLRIDRDFYMRMIEHIKPWIGDPDCGTDNNGDQEIHTMFIKNKIVKIVYSISKGYITTVLP